VPAVSGKQKLDAFGSMEKEKYSVNRQLDEMSEEEQQKVGDASGGSCRRTWAAVRSSGDLRGAGGEGNTGRVRPFGSGPSRNPLRNAPWGDKFGRLQADLPPGTFQNAFRKGQHQPLAAGVALLSSPCYWQPVSRDTVREMHAQQKVRNDAWAKMTSRFAAALARTEVPEDTVERKALRFFDSKRAGMVRLRFRRIVSAQPALPHAISRA
jgi:hypothetical protein